MNRRFPVYLLLCILLAAIVSCKDSTTEEPVVTSSSVAITSFKLAKDTGVIVNLDSVFFTIDLNKAEVFNADSLPKGSNIKKLVVSIGLPVVSSAQLIVKGGSIMKDTTINYITNSKDSIDFTGSVILRLESEDRTAKRDYALKVNVHNMKPDSLYWNELARRDLPSIGNPIAQRTVELGNAVFCLIKEDDRYIMSSSTDLAGNNWTKNIVNLPFTPNVKSFTASDNKLYILSDAGALYSSIDGLSWEDCNTRFTALLGGYENRLLGLIADNDGYKHDEYPRRAGFQMTKCDQDFPVMETSPMISFTTEWSVSPQSILIGGVDQNHQVVGDTWGYDGNEWAKISKTSIPARSGVVLIPYFTYKTNKKRWVVTKHTTWVAIGGRKADGGVTKDVYISLDAGLNWKKGDSLLQLPTYISDFANAQAVVSNTPMSIARSSDGWELISSLELPVWFRVSPLQHTRGYVQTWECPYIYMFGGENSSGTVHNNIWKGVINRLSFKPLI